MICFRIICSSNLQDVLVNDIGLKLDGVSVSPDLWIGVTLATFQSSGSLEVKIDLRKIRPRYALHNSAYLLRKILGMSSGPLAFLGSSFSRRLRIPASVMSMGPILALVVVLRGGRKLLSYLNTE